MKGALLGALAGALFGILFMKQCNSPETKITHHETFTTDTIKPEPILKTVEVKVAGPVRTYTVEITDTFYCNRINIYSDSVIDDKCNIYTVDSVNGVLLGQKISYRLKVPLMITNTHTIIDSVFVRAPQGGFYLSGGIGVSKQSNALFLGLDYVSKGKYGYGIAYDALGKSVNGFVRWRVR